MRGGRDSGAAAAGRRGAPLDLIHRNNSPKPALARLSGRLTPPERAVSEVRYSVEWGVSPAVVEAAFAIAVKLNEGGYDRPAFQQGAYCTERGAGMGGAHAKPPR